jgi:DNA-binding response OmpR family regulator
MTISEAKMNLPMKVLVAEDDSATRMMLVSSLKKWGYEVIEVIDGAAAWQIISQPHAPQLLIMDCVMPGLSGYALCERIRKELPDAYGHYIILLTQDSGSDNVVKGLDAGANEFLTKPFQVAELRSRVSVGEKIIRYENELSEKNLQLQQYILQIETASLLALNASRSLGNAISDINNNEKPQSEPELSNHDLKQAHSTLEEIIDVFKNFNPEKSSKKSK